jgi:hypothetical protein
LAYADRVETKKDKKPINRNYNKHGEEIYEGDIIRSFDSNGNSIYHHIEYRGASFVAILKIDHFPVDRIESTLTQDWLNEFDKVIIGNIHDDKDYLIK